MFRKKNITGNVTVCSDVERGGLDIQRFMLAFVHKSRLKLNDKVAITDVKITGCLKPQLWA
jgi:hypothetical protein